MPSKTSLAIAAAVAACLALRVPAHAAPGEAQVDDGPRVPTPVTFRGETVFEVRAPLGTLAPSERGHAIDARLRAVADGRASVIDEIHTEERGANVDVLAGPHLLLSVTAADARPTGRTPRQLAADAAFKIHGALARDFRDRSVRGVAIGAVYTGVATLTLVLALWLISRAEGRMLALLRRLSSEYIDRRLAPLGIGSVGEVLAAAAGLLRVLGTLLLLYLYINVVLNSFPWTRGIASVLFGYVRSALGWVVTGVVSYLPNLVYVAVTLLATRYIVRLARLVFDAIERGTIKLSGFHPEWSQPTYKIARFLILAFAAVIIFPYLPGSSSPAFRGVSVFLGVLFSLGSASSVGNVLSGVVLTYMRPFQLGDRVKVADAVGDVVAKNLLVVRLRTIKNVEITIPNAIVLGSHITNYSAMTRTSSLILNTSVTLGYSTPWRQIHELLLSAARKTDGVLEQPAPFVLQTALDDFYVRYELNAHTQRANEMATIYSALHANIQDAFNEAGVEIMSPHYASLRDGNAIAIPARYFPDGYEAPGFRVSGPRPKP